MGDRIRAAREGRGWSQTELANRAGVSRQLLGSVEAGRQIPNVKAALGIARALETSVEWLFDSDDVNDTSDTAEPVLGAPIPIGAAVLTGFVGGRRVAVPVEHGVGNGERWVTADAIMGDDRVHLLPDATESGILLAGCDPALGVLADLLSRLAPPRSTVATRSAGAPGTPAAQAVASGRPLVVHASTGRSLAALAAGRVHAVVVHGRRGRMPATPRPVLRWHLAEWQVGLASSRTSGVPTVEEMVERRMRVVQRDEGAGSQQALTRAISRAGVRATGSLPGPVADGHVDVARRVASGAGVAGVTMEAAARCFGLRFLPLEEHTVELWVDKRWSDLAAVSSLVSLLHSPSFLSRLRAVGGYDLTGCGTERSS